MRLGHGSRKRFPWWCWRAMVLVALVTLPGATPVVGADEATVFTDPPRVSRESPVGDLVERPLDITLDTAFVHMSREIFEQTGIELAPKDGHTTLSPREARLFRTLAGTANASGVHPCARATLLDGQTVEMPASADSKPEDMDAGKLFFRAEVTNDRRAVRLEVSVNGQKPSATRETTLVADGHTLLLEVTEELPAIGRSLEKPVGVPVAPGSRMFRRIPDATGKTFLLITPKIVIEEEVEEKIASGGLILGGVTPRIIIQEEEEEQLGIFIP